MKKYNKKEYLKYVKGIEKGLNLSKESAIDFKTWKWVQPIADKAVGITNKIIKSHISKNKGGF